MTTLRLLAVFLLSLASLQAKFVPTPQQAVSFDLNKDPRKWEAKFLDGDKSGIILEFVLPGESVEAWHEMVSQQIAFTPAPLRAYVDFWESLLRKADPKIEIKETPLKDGSLLVSYNSLSASECSLRRFIQGKDGVYMIAYLVRPKLKNEALLKTWQEIIIGANLVANPEATK